MARTEFISLFITAFLTISCPTTNAQSSKVDFQHKSAIDSLNKMIDSWHHAAAVADAPDFFDAMSEDCIYIGTDASERWTKAEFSTFAKPYFDRGKAWDFKPFDRDLHVTNDGKHAWFSELLTTWMGVCRGSGMLSRSGNGWKIVQYHLSVTVPNDAIKDFIKLVDDFNRRPKK